MGPVVREVAQADSEAYTKSKFQRCDDFMYRNCVDVKSAVAPEYLATEMRKASAKMLLTPFPPPTPPTSSRTCHDITLDIVAHRPTWRSSHQVARGRTLMVVGVF